MKDSEATVDNLEECGCCGCYHRPEFTGDCREDAERFAVPEEVIAAIHGICPVCKENREKS